ncbi:phosphoglucosamine mutase [Candidatus Saccharibacteria bacterium]|nr:phosphoglucosamine mutase [Candidatus Saccharibacteria bacterium]
MKYFGTDGIRQEASKFTTDFIADIIAGLAAYTSTIITDRPAKVLIGGDTRESTEWILQDLSQALETFGFDYASVGILPTPAINYCFYQMGFDYAIDVTASHNPFTDNGIKIFERGATSGVKLSNEGCTHIERALANPQTYSLISPTDRADLHADALALYAEHLRDYLGDVHFTNLKIGLDCANGATSVINKQIFEALGATVELLSSTASYNRIINMGCGSTHLEQLKSLVRENSIDFGVAYDGDGDRCLLVDHQGRTITGDEIIAIIANYLHLDSIAVTVMSNQGLLNWAAAQNIHTEITDVGDSNVAAAMREKHIPLGGEESGHIILPGEPTGDGILTSLLVTKIISETGSSLHDLASIITKLPTVSLTIPATPAQKEAVEKDTAINSIIAHFSEKVKREGGRLLVRPSGTEPKIRITLWGTDETIITKLASELKEELCKSLN